MHRKSFLGQILLEFHQNGCDFRQRIGRETWLKRTVDLICRGEISCIAGQKLVTSMMHEAACKLTIVLLSLWGLMHKIYPASRY